MPGYTQTGDPIDDAPGPRRTDCRAGGRCDGSGWCQVTQAGADGMYPDPPPPPLDSTDAELADYARECRRAAALRKAAAASFYPCRDCNADVFFRWAGGHHAPGHSCADCVARRGATRVRRT